MEDKWRIKRGSQGSEVQTEALFQRAHDVQEGEESGFKQIWMGSSLQTG